MPVGEGPARPSFPPQRLPLRQLSVKQHPVKRSLAIAGHRTSLSIEPIFWEMLKAFAKQDGLSLAALIASLDEGRTQGEGAPVNLSSTLRVYVVERLLARMTDLP